MVGNFVLKKEMAASAACRALSSPSPVLCAIWLINSFMVALCFFPSFELGPYFTVSGTGVTLNGPKVGGHGQCIQWVHRDSALACRHYAAKAKLIEL
jgi:hypothetical protein